MILFHPNTIRLIFMTTPFMIIIVLLVVIGASGLVILSAQHCRRYRYGNHKGSTE